MSNIEELRLRLEDAERRFGLKSAKNNQYSVRLVQLVDAVVDDLWVQRRDNERLNFENDEFRSMLMTLLATIEGGGKDNLRNMMAEMAERIATLMAAGAGVPAYDPVLERYPDPEFDPEPEPEILLEVVPEVAPEVVDVSPAPPPPDVAVVSEPEVPPTAAAEVIVEAVAIDTQPTEIEQSIEAPEIDVDAITAAVVELANNTESIKPVLDFGPAKPQTSGPAVVQEAAPIASPVTEAAAPPVSDEVVTTQIAETIAAPAPSTASPTDVSPDNKPRTGEFADLHNVLDDIRALVGLIDIDTPFTPTEPGQV
jgi:hypothetical protein